MRPSILLFLVACKKAAPCPESVPTGAPALTPFESSIIDPILEDVRAGVRPFSDESVGICRIEGRRCAEFLGLTVEEPLAPGRYAVFAELAVPKSGTKGTWKVTFAFQCGSDSPVEREYRVMYAGEERGYTLSPLHNIDSPNAQGQEACSYTLTALHPDGDRVMQGGWVTPGP